MESVEHLLFSSTITSSFWKHVLSWLRDNYVRVGRINEPGVTFGKFDNVKDYILINHILLLGKYYIYYRKCQNSLPTLRGFFARTRRVINIELHIAKEKNKLVFHLPKWEKLINERKQLLTDATPVCGNAVSLLGCIFSLLCFVVVIIIFFFFSF